MTAKCKKRQKMKFDTMLTRREHGHRNTNDCGNNTERWIHNYSSKELTPNEKSVLAYLLFFLAYAVHQMNMKLSLLISFSVSMIAYFFIFFI